jgi:hypothetical protein
MPSIWQADRLIFKVLNAKKEIFFGVFPQKSNSGTIFQYNGTETL